MSTFIFADSGAVIPVQPAPVKAYGDINFGDSKEVVEKKVLKNPKIEVSPYLTFSVFFMADINIPVGRDTYSFSMDFDFFNDQLYQVTISSPDRTASYFDSDVKAFRDKLVEIVESQYGAPSWTKDLSFSDIDPGYIWWSHRWLPNDLGQEKEINIGFREYKYEYSAMMYIEYPPLVEAKNQAETEAERKATEKASGNF
ncbi:MAG: hypothetical protein JJE17_13205 [Peptostreptococcaceae bacterium]|nr:hypothetical protein [Peptostreptococcaceae bacterium]